MARNGLARVDWAALGPKVLEVALEEIRNNGRSGYLQRTVRRFPKESGITRTTLHNWLRGHPHWSMWSAQAAADPSFREPATVESIPQPDPLEVERGRLERMRVLSEERKLLRDVSGEQSLRASLEKLLREITPTFPVPPIPKPVSTKQGTATETLLLQLSDWHAYEIVDPERMRGFNAYDADIFGRRVKRVVTNALHIKARMERGGGWAFPTLVIGANGDFVSGTIHELERHTDAPHIVAAVYGCAHVFAQAVRELSTAFPRVEVFCTAGNHGRLPDARRMQQKDPTRNWDSLIYLIARDLLREAKHIRWFIPNSYSVAFDIVGWRFLQTHGHDVRSWNQIPHYGINRLVGNLNALESSLNRAINYFLLGHFHNKTSLEHAAGEWFVNGSLIGGNEFSMQAMGRVDKPCQWMVAVHPDHGVTHRWPLDARAPDDAPTYDVRAWQV